MSCSSSSSEPREWSPADHHDEADAAEPQGEGAKALPVGKAVPMPRDHAEGGGAPAEMGGGMPQDAVHGGEGEGPGLPLEWQAPEGWRSVPPASAMRKAEWALPKVEGDGEDASLVVFYFGSGQGGDVQSNLDRWYGQFEQPDGRATRGLAQVEHRTISGMRITLADVTGTFRGGMPGGPPAEPRPDTRMLAAIVEASSGPWFFKLVGPKRTVEHWRASFDAFLGSLRPAPSS